MRAANTYRGARRNALRGSSPKSPFGFVQSNLRNWFDRGRWPGAAKPRNVYWHNVAKVADNDQKRRAAGRWYSGAPRL